jgi:hypothetical protein
MDLNREFADGAEIEKQETKKGKVFIEAKAPYQFLNAATNHGHNCGAALEVSPR